MTSDLFSSVGLPLPNMVGPDQGGYTPIASVAADLPAGVLDAYTYHQYPECVAPSPADGYVFDPSCLLQLDTLAAQCVSAAANYSAKDWPVPPVWAGESADHSVRNIRIIHQDYFVVIHSSKKKKFSLPLPLLPACSMTSLL